MASPRRTGDILPNAQTAPAAPTRLIEPVQPRRDRSRRRYAVLALATILVALAGMLIVLVAIDLYLHRKYERTASVNIWGYRGPAIGARQAGEVRVGVLGGSTAFGYGPDWDGSFPYLLERRLNERPATRRFTVVNLAYNNEGAFAFRPTLEDYAYLGLDIAILYEGYNDLGDEPLRGVYRRRSAVFRLTGYLPILTLILREKALAILYEGDISRGYRGDQTVFRPGLGARTASGALNAAAETAASLERQLGRLTALPDDEAAPVPATTCSERWKLYCGAVFDAIEWARARGIRVIVATQPYISDRHVSQQQALLAALQPRLAADRGIVHVNLGRAVNLADGNLCYDGMHLTAAGNAVIAAALAPPVLSLASDRP
jgi:hypothetical protein